MKIKEGNAASRFALRKSQNLNAAFELVKGILHNSRAEFNYYMGPSVRGRNYILKKHGNLKGFAILGPNKSNGTVKLHLIGTEPGKGYGSILMKKIRNNAYQERHLMGIVISDPVGPARNFYRKLGAVNIPKGSGNSNATSLMYLNAYNKIKRKRSPSPVTSRQRSPSHQSPPRPSSSSLASVRRRAGKTPRH